jgi:uncharacterized protein
MPPAIFDAIAAGDLATVTKLVEEKDALDQRNDAGISPVLFAAYAGKSELMPILLAHAKALDVFEASAVGRPDRVKELVDADATLLNAWSPDGFTPLHYAAFFAQEGVMTSLLERGPDVNVVSRNEMRVTPLNSAAAGGKLSICSALIAEGAEVDARQHGGYTPLHAAAQRGDRLLVDLLIASGANVGLKTDEGKTAADIARDAGHGALAEILKE